MRFAFYRKDYVLVLNPDGSDAHFRATFLRGRDGAIEWLRFGGRLYAHGSAARALSGGTMSLPGTLPHPSRF